MVRDEEISTVDMKVEETIQRMTGWLVPASTCVQYGGHWLLVTCDVPNLFTDSSMETPRFHQVVAGLVGE